MAFEPDAPIDPGFIDPNGLFRMVQNLSGKRRYYSSMGSGQSPAMSFGDPDKFQALLNQSQQQARLLMSNT